MTRNVSEDVILLDDEDAETDVFRKLSNACEEDELDKDEDVEQECPPASALTRRRALVPPKSLSDGYDSATDDADVTNSQTTPPAGSSTEGGTTFNRHRRNSIVVIPPMQICPGDLLVYSKVLTQRNNLLASSIISDLDGSTTSLAVNDDTSRKGKNTFSFLRLFDRSNRAKSESLCGLEEVLTTISPSEFNDEQLTKYKGMMWYDFVTSFEDRISCCEVSIPSPDSSPSSIRQLPSPMAGPLGSSPTGSPMAMRPDHLNVGMTSRNEQKRKEAVWDLFQSECMFLYDHLMVLKNVFMEPLKKIQVEGYAMFAEPEVLFGNLDELCGVTYAFCKEFVNLILQDVSTTGDIQTTDILMKLYQKGSKALSLSQAFHRYSLNYINALNYLETLRRHVEFIEFEKWCQRDPRCKKLQLTDLLVAPVQHIMKIPLILRDIELRTDDSTEKEVIGQILETEENSLRELDDKMKWLKNFERLLEIQRNIQWPSVMELDPKAFVPDFLKGPLSKQPCEKLIVSPRRQIIIEGPLMLLEAGKPTEMFLILFDDMLLITRRKKGLHKKKSSITENWPSSCSRGSASPFNPDSSMRYVVYKQPLSLDRFFIHDVSLHDATMNKVECAFVLVCLNRFQQIVTVFTFQASNDQIKQTWLAQLKATQEKWKRTLQNTVFRNQRLDGSASPSSGLK